MVAELLLPVATTVFALGRFDVTLDTSTGLVVVHVSVTSHALAPDAMVHDGDEGDRLPDIGAAHLLPFQLVPEAQLADAELLSSSTPLL